MEGLEPTSGMTSKESVEEIEVSEGQLTWVQLCGRISTELEVSSLVLDDSRPVRGDGRSGGTVQRVDLTTSEV